MIGFPGGAEVGVAEVRALAALRPGMAGPQGGWRAERRSLERCRCSALIQPVPTTLWRCPAATLAALIFADATGGYVAAECHGNAVPVANTAPPSTPTATATVRPAKATPTPIQAPVTPGPTAMPRPAPTQAPTPRPTATPIPAPFTDARGVNLAGAEFGEGMLPRVYDRD